MEKEEFKRRSIVKKKDFVFEDGEKLPCQAMNELERSEYEVRFVNSDGEIDKSILSESRRVLIQKCVLGPDGKRMFAESEIDQIGMIDSSFAGDLDDFLRDLCGLNKQRTVRDARKN